VHRHQTACGTRTFPQLGQGQVWLLLDQATKLLQLAARVGRGMAASMTGRNAARLTPLSQQLRQALPTDAKHAGHLLLSAQLGVIGGKHPFSHVYR